MQKLTFEPIPKESSDFIFIGTPTYVHPNNKNNDELLSGTLNDIEFLKNKLEEYNKKCSSDEGSNNKIFEQKSGKRQVPLTFETSNSPKNDKRPLKSSSIYDRQKRIIVPKRSKKKVKSTSENGNNPSFVLFERTSEYLFIKKKYKSIIKQKQLEYQKICHDLISKISSIIHFVQIHYDQKIPITVDHQKFLDYCSSFFEKNGTPYHELTFKEEILSKKLQQLSQLTKYPIISLNQLQSELVSLLNIGNENDNQSKDKKKKRSKSKKIKNEENENTNENINNDNNQDMPNERRNTVIGKKQPFFDSHLDYAPYSTIDDFLFYFIHSNNVHNSNNKFHDPPEIEIQKIALEITGISERNSTFTTKNISIEEANPNYSLFNSYLDQLFTLILSDQTIFDHLQENQKEKMIKIYQHQIKTVISIAFTRIIFDAAYLFNYDYLLNSIADEKNRQYLHFNQGDEIIEINSKIIQSLLPRDLDIPDGFLVDYSMHKSQSTFNLQSQSNISNSVSDSATDSDSELESASDPNLALASSLNASSFFSFIPIKRSNRTIHELMAREEDFLNLAEKLQDLQFYSNPIDISFYIHKIFSGIQARLYKISQLSSKKNKSSDNIYKENGIPRSKSREFDPFIQFDDLFLYFLVVFTFSPPRNSKWIAAMLKRFAKLVPNMQMQQSASFFIGVVNYTATFPSNEEFSPELMEHIQEMRNNLTKKKK